MWTSKLKSVYKSRAKFVAWDETYALASRLGFYSADAAWNANPKIQGSSNPKDYCITELRDWDKVDDGCYSLYVNEYQEIQLKMDGVGGYDVSLLDSAILTAPFNYSDLLEAISAANTLLKRIDLLQTVQ
jgi:hypothetical protein